MYQNNSIILEPSVRNLLNTLTEKEGIIGKDTKDIVTYLTAYLQRLSDHKNVATLKNFTTITLLNDIINASNNLIEEQVVIAAKYGVGKTATRLGASIARTAFSRGIKVDFDINKVLEESVFAELRSDRARGERISLDNTASQVFMVSGMRFGEQVANDVLGRSSLADKRRQLAQGKIPPYLHELFPNPKQKEKVIKDLQEGRQTYATNLVALRDISDLRPVSFLELPAGAFKSNTYARYFLHLKSWIIKRYELLTDEALTKIFTPTNPGDRLDGAKTLIRFLIALQIFGLPRDWIEQALRNRGGLDTFPYADIPDYVIENTLRMIGVNRYSYDVGQTYGVGTGFGTFLVPVQPFHIIDSFLNLRFAPLFPVFGQFFHDWIVSPNREDDKERERVNKRIYNQTTSMSEYVLDEHDIALSGVTIPVGIEDIMNKVHKETAIV